MTANGFNKESETIRTILLGKPENDWDAAERSDLMAIASIEIKLPSPAKAYVLDDTTEEMRKALLLYPSIANNSISHGRAAELLGMHKMELIKLYSKLGIPYLDMTDDEFTEEIQTVKRLVSSRV